MDSEKENSDVPTDSNREIGRGPGGRFARGNAGGPGNPAIRHAAILRKRLDDALKSVCTSGRLKKAVESVMALAEQGDITAFRILCDRLVGPPVAGDIIERLNELESQLEREDADASSTDVY